MPHYTTIPLESLSEVTWQPADTLPIVACPACKGPRKQLMGKRGADFAYRCPACRHEWLCSKVCQACAEPATTTRNGFGLCQPCAALA